MANLRSLHKVLAKGIGILPGNLHLDNILQSMEANDALKHDDVTKIQTKVTSSDQMMALLDRLRTMPEKSYLYFMELLQIERDDLYVQMKEVERICEFVPGE